MPAEPPADAPTDSAATIVREYWRLMATNDFASVGAVLTPDVVLDWPQSNERIHGAADIERMNHEYPANGRWQFTINRIVGGDGAAVTDVSVTDSVQRARVISFFTLRDGLIERIVEFWPEPYDAPAGREHLVVAIPAGEDAWRT